MGIYDKVRETVSEVSIFVARNLVERMLGFFLIPIYTRTFEPAEYGVLFWRARPAGCSAGSSHGCRWAVPPPPVLEPPAGRLLAMTFSMASTRTLATPTIWV